MPAKKKLVFTYRDPIGVDWSDEIKVSTVPVKTKKIFQTLRQHLKKTFNRNIRKGGMTIEIKAPEVEDIADTLENFSKIVFEETVNGAAAFLYDVVGEGLQEARAKEWRKIAESIRDHMQLLAYKRPAERRGLVQEAPYFKKYRKLEIKDLVAQKHPDVMVSRWGGVHPVALTGALKDSIGYKIIYSPDRPKRRRWRKLPSNLANYLKARVQKRREEYEKARQMAIGIRVGPGAGQTPAPTYTDAANDGAGPIMDMYYVPGWGADGRGRMITMENNPAAAKGKMWGGFEGKFFIEGTGLWLQKQQKRLVMDIDMMSRIYVMKAINDYKSTMKASGLVADIQNWMIRDLQKHAIRIIRKRAKVSTNEMLVALGEALVKGKEGRKRQRGRPA